MTDTRIRLLFTPEQLAGMGRCPTCGWHPPTQNHDPRCPEHQPTETKGA